MHLIVLGATRCARGQTVTLEILAPDYKVTTLMHRIVLGVARGARSQTVTFVIFAPELKLGRSSCNCRADLAIGPPILQLNATLTIVAPIYIFGRQFRNWTAILAIVAPILPLDLQYCHWTVDLAIVAPI